MTSLQENFLTSYFPLSRLDPFSLPSRQHVTPALHTLLPLTPSAIICSNFFNNHLYTKDSRVYEFVLSFLLSFLEETQHVPKLVLFFLRPLSAMSHLVNAIILL